ncbi:MAG TPA: ABC transporter ATP-binding protein, partial [Smithellaceae bacterium]|nr:ABC transporter ATP-binding protein [Smithellaceae bacterium]
MALLEAKEIGFSYGEKQILTDVSFTLDSAQVTAVIGPNGSGKTTLLKIINGTLFPASGEMLIAGRKTQNWPRRELAATAAIVPQETPAVFPFYAEEIVLMGRFPHLSGLRFEGDGDYR